MDPHSPYILYNKGKRAWKSRHCLARFFRLFGGFLLLQ
jgi:hypothetical protein